MQMSEAFITSVFLALSGGFQDAGLTEDNIRISLSHDVLCGIEPFVDGGSHTSL